MKIALVADTFPPMRTSGAVQLRDLAREFVRKGHDLTILLPEPTLDRPWRLEPFEGAQILRLKAPSPKNNGYVRRTLGEWRMPYAMLRNLRKTQLVAQQWEGVVWYSPSIFHGPLVRALKSQSGCKSYLIIRDIFPEWAVDLGIMHRGLVYQGFKRIAHQQYAVADTIGVQTTGNLKYFESWRQSQPGRSLEVLQNWLDVPATKQCSIRFSGTSLAGRKIFVYAGNMGVAQGMDIILNLAERLKSLNDVGFLFVGRGSDVNRLKALATSKSVNNVLFHDEIDPDEIPDLYAQCLAGVVALDPRHKTHNIPGKFLTYMQNRLPVLANVNSGNDLVALIRDENVGEVCETNNLDELETRCRALIDKAESDPLLPERCIDLFHKNFSVCQAVQQIVAALQHKSEDCDHLQMEAD